MDWKLTLSEWISVNVGWPVVGWILFCLIAAVAVAWIVYEVTGEIRRTRHIARREADRRGQWGRGPIQRAEPYHGVHPESGPQAA